jgi:sec-independent protein translocase protein TatC
LPWTQEEARERVLDEHLLLDKYRIDLRELMVQLKNAYPEQFNSVPLNQDSQKAGKLSPLPLWHPSMDDARLQSKSLGTVEAFTVWVKASLLVGVLLASPWIFYQIWHFVAAGLYPHERYYVHIYLPVSLGLFLLGASLAFFVVFEPVLNFLLSFNRNLGIAPEPRINEWLSFVLILPIGFGLGFQLPLVMLFMERIGLFTVKNYLEQWRIAVLAIFVLAAIFAPPDPYSMLLMAFPLTILYFGGILLCKLLPRKSNPFGEIAIR